MLWGLCDNLNCITIGRRSQDVNRVPPTAVRFGISPNDESERVERLFRVIESTLQAATAVPTAATGGAATLVGALAFGPFGIVAGPLFGFLANQISTEHHGLNKLTKYTQSRERRREFIEKVAAYFGVTWEKLEGFSADILADAAEVVLKFKT